MPRERDPNRERAFKLYEESGGNIDLVEIASQLNISAGTVRGWKSKDKWEEKLNGTFQKRDSERSKRSQSKVNKKVKEAIADEVDEVIENPNLNDKQRLFCIYYIRCFNATKAYQKAYGCDYATAASIGYRLLENVGVKEEILRLKQVRFNREFLNEEDIFQKYMDIAFSDITDYTEFGNKEIEVLNESTGEKEKLTISYVNVKDSSSVDGTLISEVSKGRDGVKVKLADKMKALQWLTDHMNLATTEQRAKIAVLTAKIDTGNEGEDVDDGFIDALNGSAREDWEDEERD